MKMTEADYQSWRFVRDAVHFNGGKVFFGYGHRCVDQPRLLVIDKYFKKDRSTQRSYLIDSKTACDTLDEALAALEQIYEIDDAERQLLQSASDDWFIPEKWAPLIAMRDAGLLDSDKRPDGFYFRRTKAGRAALQHESSRALSAESQSDANKGGV